MKNLLLCLLITAAVFNCSSKSSNQSSETEHNLVDSTEIIFENNNTTSATTSKSNTEEDLVIYEDSFYGISPGDKIADHANKIEEYLLRTGEGEFDVYLIKNENGDELGFFFIDHMDESLVENIIVNTNQATTKEGIKKGMTFQELTAILDDYEVHGSEIEGRVYVRYGNFAIRLDYNHWEYELDQNKIPKSSKVLDIQISKQYEMNTGQAEDTATGSSYYICYGSDDGAAKDLAVLFNEKGKAQSVRYKGQTQDLKLKFVREESRTTAYSTDTQEYQEMLDGKVNGIYAFTKSGNWYYAKYKPNNGKKVFEFTFIAKKSFSEVPCF